MTDFIIYKTFIKAKTSDVFKAVTTGEGWQNWFTQEATIDPVPGGSMKWRWRGFGPDFNTFEEQGEVLEIVKDQKFIFRWKPVGKDHATQVTIKFFSEHGGTIVRVKDEGYPVHSAEFQRLMMECACGWGEALTLLKFYMEYGISYQMSQKENDEITGTYAVDDI